MLITRIQLGLEALVSLWLSNPTPCRVVHVIHGSISCHQVVGNRRVRERTPCAMRLPRSTISGAYPCAMDSGHFRCHCRCPPSYMVTNHPCTPSHWSIAKHLYIRSNYNSPEVQLVGQSVSRSFGWHKYLHEALPRAHIRPHNPYNKLPRTGVSLPHRAPICLVGQSHMRCAA